MLGNIFQKKCSILTGTAPMSYTRMLSIFVVFALSILDWGMQANCKHLILCPFLLRFIEMPKLAKNIPNI